MIGNWIKIGSTNDTVMELKFDRREGWLVNGVPDNRIYGIELTPEILEKCPQLKMKYLGYGITEYEIGYLTLQTADGIFYNLSCNGCHLTNPKYLHQLQNIGHALTGEHLKIEL